MVRVALRFDSSNTAQPLGVHRLGDCDPADGTIRLMAPGLWRFDGEDEIVCTDRMVLRKRLMKYHARGYSRLFVPTTMKIRDHAGIVHIFPTPKCLLAECEAFNRGDCLWAESPGTP